MTTLRNLDATSSSYLIFHLSSSDSASNACVQASFGIPLSMPATTVYVPSGWTVLYSSIAVDLNVVVCLP